MKRLILASLALALSACATAPAVPPPAPVATAPAKLVLPAAVDAVAETAAALADATRLAPPATLTAGVTFPAVAVNRAFRSFDKVLTVIDAARDSGLLVPGTPLALRIQALGRDVQRWLNAASAAQRVQDAASYAVALDQAKVALARFNTALAR